MVRVSIVALLAVWLWPAVPVRAQVDPLTALLERDGFRLLDEKEP
jgi:hypothetical protein